MKRFDRCLVYPHVPRMVARALVLAIVCGWIEVTGCAQGIAPDFADRMISNTRTEEAYRPLTGGLLNLRAGPIAAGGEVRKAEPSEGLELIPEDPLPELPLDYLQERERRLQTGFNWNAAFRQSMIFLGIQHSFRLATEKGTRADLVGPFWADYLKSVRSLRGWSDGDPFLVNYIGHPMMGGVTGFIQIQNDPAGIREQIGWTKSYWRSRLKAFAWSAAYSTQFELGLVSEATLGNIGIRPYGKSRNPMAFIDLVVTPVAGTAWLIGEDALDRYVINKLERVFPNRITTILLRGFLNPTRSFANLMRGNVPWHRDNR